VFYKGLQSESKKYVDISTDGALMGRDGDVARELLDKVEYNENQWTLKPLIKVEEKDELALLKAKLAMLEQQLNTTVSKPQNSKTLDELSDEFTVENTQQQIHTQFSKNAKKNQSEHQIQSMTLRSGTKLAQPEATRGAEQPQNHDLVVEDDSSWTQPYNQTGMVAQPSGWPTSRPTIDSATEPKPSAVLSQRPTVPYPGRLQSKDTEKQFAEFVKILSQIEITMPLMDALQQIPKYAKYMKELLTGKRTLDSCETVKATEECNVVLLDRMPKKSKDPGSFIIPCIFSDSMHIKALCDSGASVNLMSLSVYRKLGLGELRPTKVTIQLADRSTVYPQGIAEDVIVRVEDLHFPVDFLVMEIEEDREAPLILGRPFLTTGQAMIDFKAGTLTLSVEEDGATKEITYQALEGMRLGANFATCFQVDTVDKYIGKQFRRTYLKDPLEEGSPLAELIRAEEVATKETVCEMDTSRWRRVTYESLGESPAVPQPSIVSPPELELKKLPSHLKYAFLGENSTLPVIISSSLTVVQEGKLLKMLGNYKEAIGWSIADIKGISPAICMHKILMEESYKPTVQPQRRLNPNMQEVVKKEVLKLLDAGIIYPISDSAWVSPVQCVPKKGGITVVTNEQNELIPTRTVTGWRVCMDYRKLNSATRKDHFPLPFIDQMLERLAGKDYYCFLDGYSGYNQIAIAPEDQEKTTFTCPYS
jgi:hypothetical protein